MYVCGVLVKTANIFHLPLFSKKNCMHVYILLCYNAVFRYVSCVLGCPYEGKVSPKAVADVCKHSSFTFHINPQVYC